MSSNTILLKCNGHIEEYPADAALSPGHLLMVNSTGEVLKHNSAGAQVPVLVALENALYGKTINDAFAAGDRVPVIVGSKGDIVQVRLKLGQTAVRGDGLVSSGDGTVSVGDGTALPPGLLYRSTAASANHTNTTDEALFDKTYTIPANSLRAGDVLKITAVAFVVAVAANDTMTCKLYIGGLAGVAVCTTGADDVEANDIVQIEAEVVVRSIGATGKIVATGTTMIGLAGTAVHKIFALAETTLDTTVANVVGVGADWSAAAAGNQIRLEQLTIELNRTGGSVALLYAEEAMDASGAEKLVRARVA